MSEILVTRDPDGLPVYSLKKRRLEINNPIQKSIASFLVAGAIGLIVWQCQDGQAQTPNVNIIPTPTSIPNVPTPESTPTRTSPTAAPKPTPTIAPTSEPTRMPVPTMRPTSTHPPAPEPIVVPPNTPEPTSTPAPIPQPPPTPIGASISELRVGEPLNLTRCFTNTLEGSKKRSVEFVSAGLQKPEKIYEGNKKYVKVEIKVPLTQQEILEKKKKDPNNKETTKFVKENEIFNVDPSTTCIDLKVSTHSGSSLDCYRTFSMNYKTREGSSKTLETATLLENFCTGWILKGSILSYDYNSATNTGTVVLIIENPAVKNSQQTTLKMVKPCSFLDFAEQEVQNQKSDSRIFPDKLQTIPPEERIIYVWKFVYPDEKQPTSPLYCTLVLTPKITD